MPNPRDYSPLINRKAVRDLRIRAMVQGMEIAGMSHDKAIEVIQNKFHLGKESVRKIVRGKK
mgnify:FL=1|jgi:hypothetical protein